MSITALKDSLIPGGLYSVRSHILWIPGNYPNHYSFNIDNNDLVIFIRDQDFLYGNRNYPRMFFHLGVGQFFHTRSEPDVFTLVAEPEE